MSKCACTVISATQAPKLKFAPNPTNNNKLGCEPPVSACWNYLKSALQEFIQNWNTESFTHHQRVLHWNSLVLFSFSFVFFCCCDFANVHFDFNVISLYKSFDLCIWINWVKKLEITTSTTNSRAWNLLVRLPSLSKRKLGNRISVYLLYSDFPYYKSFLLLC